MADLTYNSFYKDIADGTIDLDTDTIKVMLTTSDYTPDASHDFKDDITNEVSGTGYTAGGATLQNASVTLDGSESKFDADDVTWSSSTITARYAVMYKSTGDDATSPLIACWDFGSDKSSSNSDFTIVWDSSGILRFKAAS